MSLKINNVPIFNIGLVNIEKSRVFDVFLKQYLTSAFYL